MTEKPACAQNQAWMEDEFNRELSADLRPQIQAHLEGCEECRSIWADYQALRRGMDVLAEEEGPSLRVQNAVLRAADAKVEKRSAKHAGFWSWLLNPATIAFATLVLIAGVGYLGREELIKKKNSELSTPILAPQGMPSEGASQPSAAVKAPVAPGRLVEAPAEQEKQAAPAATKPTTFSAPAKPESPKQVPAETVDRARRALPPPPPPPAAPAPASDQLAPANAPSKSLAQPTEARPQAEEGKASSANPVAPASNDFRAGKRGVAPQDKSQSEAPAAPPTGGVIPEADSGSGGGLGAVKKEEAAPKEKKADQEAPTGGALKDLESSQTPELQMLGTSSQSKAKEPREHAQVLLDSARAKIQKQDYAGALEDLLAAQRLKDSKEIQDLILLCRSHLRGDG